MKRPSTAAILTLAVAAGMLAALFAGNPYDTSWRLKCPLHSLTGWLCPLCGIQRQLHALMHLRLAEAWRLNPLLLCAYPYLLCLLAGQLSARFRQTALCQWCHCDRTLLAALLLLLAWGLARNLTPALAL